MKTLIIDGRAKMSTVRRQGLRQPTDLIYDKQNSIWTLKQYLFYYLNVFHIKATNVELIHSACKKWFVSFMFC